MEQAQSFCKQSFWTLLLQAVVQFLRSENVQLNDKPVPPESHLNISRGLDAKKIEEDENWITYW